MFEKHISQEQGTENREVRLKRNWAGLDVYHRFVPIAPNKSEATAIAASNVSVLEEIGFANKSLGPDDSSS